MKFIYLILIMLLFQSCKKTGKEEQVEIGQKYSFQIDGEHPNPHFVVCEIDRKNGKAIISISISGLKFKNPQSSTGYGSEIGHAPVELSALIDHPIKLIEEKVALPDYKEGYQIWKEAFDSGTGGYFTIGPDKVVEYIVETLTQIK